MAQQTVDFDPATGDDTSGALRKLDNNVKDHETRITAVSTLAGNALPKAGGTLTGGLNGTTATFSGDVGSGGNFVSSAATAIVAPTGAGSISLRPNGKASAVGQVTIASSGAMSTSGPLSVTGSFQSTGGVTATGYATRNGTGGNYAGNSFNILWTSVASLWIDNTLIGQFQFATSDPRLKRDIVYLDSPDDGDADIEKVLAARPCTWFYRDIGIFKDDGIQRRSFLSPEMQAIDPLMAPGDPEAVTEDGSIQPLNLNPDAMLSILWGALRREISLRRALESRVEALEASSA